MNCHRGMLTVLACLCAMPAIGQAAWPFTAEGPRRGSEEYYEMRAGEPFGQRQKYKAGKLWPPQARAVGKPLPWIHRYHASCYWPYPYTAMDQADVNLVSNLQIANGWQSLTTFYAYHFDEETQRLNSAGLQHLQWLLENVPIAHRQAFLAMSADSSINDRRMSNMHSTVTTLVGSADSLPIALRVSSQIGRPASEIDSIFKQRVENMDAPVIPFVKATAGPQ